MSTIKVDTIQTRSGVSEIGIDKLKGASSAASISVVGEGGTTTTNLQQGLCKQWSHHSGAASVADSFNQGSLTDNGSGDNTYSLTNNMANSNYSVTFGGGQGSTTTSFWVHCIHDGLGTSAFRYDMGYADPGGPTVAAYEWADACHQVQGDLA